MQSGYMTVLSLISSMSALCWPASVPAAIACQMQAHIFAIFFYGFCWISQGPGGVGKTYLSIEVARSVQNEFADGVIGGIGPETDTSLGLPLTTDTGKSVVSCMDVSITKAIVRKQM